MIATLDLVEMRRGGGVLTAATTAGATTLPLDVTLDYDEGGGSLSLNDVTYTYTEVGEDYVTLGTGLVADAAVDDPAWALDAQGELEETWLAWVDLGDGGDTVPAQIPTGLIGYFPEGDAATGQDVEVEATADGYRVLSRPDQIDALDQAVIDVPFIDLYRTADTTWPDDPGPGATFTGLTGWLIDSRSGMTIASGIITPAQPERYLLVLTVRWSGNSSGRRVIRLVSSVAGDLKTIPATPPDADPFTQQAVVIHRAVAGETFQALARQTSGAGLDVIGTGTTLQIVRLQA